MIKFLVTAIYQQPHNFNRKTILCFGFVNRTKSQKNDIQQKCIRIYLIFVNDKYLYNDS